MVPRDFGERLGAATVVSSDPPIASPPLRTLTFTLTRADALAYEALPREITGWRLVALLVWIGLAGAAVAQFPTEWVGEEGGWRFWALMMTGSLIQYGLATLAMTAHTHWRAARRRPQPSQVDVFDHGDRLAWREGGDTDLVSSEAIGDVITTPTHTFVPASGRVLILPLRAFLDRNQMIAFAAELERRRGE